MNTVSPFVCQLVAYRRELVLFAVLVCAVALALAFAAQTIGAGVAPHPDSPLLSPFRWIPVPNSVG